MSETPGTGHKSRRILIVGGGIVGLATALKLLRQRGVEVLVLEKEAQPGNHQSTHNSGVLHAGLYYLPGSNKARMAVTGIREMVAFCQAHEIPHEICGKLVVATTPPEVERLKVLLDRGTKNGLAGLAWLEADAMREIEPNVAGLAAVRVPEEGIVDYRRVCDVMAEQIRLAGGEVRTRTKVEGIRQNDSRWVVETSAGEISGDFLVNCAGLHCDRISRLAGEPPGDQIVPFRGEYYQLRPERAHLVRHLIYPVPDPQFPFLGVHFTRLIHGGIEAGPNAVLAFAREGYRKTDFSMRDLAESLAFPGLWRFLKKYPSMCWDETLRSFSRERFANSLRKLVPAIEVTDLALGGAGVRAQAITPQGELVQDFQFIERRNALHLLNAPSPAATSSLAIGGEIAAMVGAALERL